jgi:hypothetical protein
MSVVAWFQQLTPNQPLATGTTLRVRWQQRCVKRDFFTVRSQHASPQLRWLDAVWSVTCASVEYPPQKTRPSTFTVSRAGTIGRL